jgi:Leucine-rich repeat (LRR) protein
MKKLLPALFLLAVTAKAQLLTNDTLAVRAILDSNGYYTTPTNMVIHSERDYGINRVTGLYFSTLTPLKYLPVEIRQLDQLRELAVAVDSSAIISSEIVKLSKLEQLQLTGKLHSVPPEIFKLPELVSLDLTDNLLDSLPDNIGDAKKLRFFNLTGNHLQHLPSSIGEMTSLQCLDLHNNNISVLPTGIGETVLFY